MSTLSSSSTRDEVLAAYADNASYEEDDSVPKAKAFVTACRLLLSPKHSAVRTNAMGIEVELELELIRAEMIAAQEWLAASGESARTSAGEVMHSSFEEFRD
jgi:hypothetical protein